MKKMLIGVILIFLTLSWVIPIKFSVKSKDLKEYTKEQVVLLCTVAQITGPLWRVSDCYGIENVADHIDIIGNTPENLLRRPMYTYAETEFIFIGNFSADNPEIFEVVKWEVVGKITRGYYIIPLPSNYFNLWEYRWTKER